jgi:predicted transcriptional regulator of viral defense system
MSDHVLAREELWDVAASQHGFVTAQQAAELGVGKGALQMLVQRGTLDRATFGVYRFPRYPVSEYDPYMLAVLWTRAPEACLSHETALDAYGISDVNPNRIHVTVNKQRRLRRVGGEGYTIHQEDLTPEQITWWQEIPTVTPAIAITQCIAFGTPSHLLRQAILNGHAQGRITTTQRDKLTAALEARHGK